MRNCLFLKDGLIMPKLENNAPKRKIAINNFQNGRKNLLSGIGIAFVVTVLYILLDTPSLLQDHQLSHPFPRLFYLREYIPRPSPAKHNCCHLNEEDNYKTILLYTTFYEQADWVFGGFGHKPFVKANCPVNNCYVTNDINETGAVEKFDAVLFHTQDMLQGTLQLPDQRKRPGNQVYIMFASESPQHDGLNHSQFNGKIIVSLIQLENIY